MAGKKKLSTTDLAGKLGSYMQSAEPVVEVDTPKEQNDTRRTVEINENSINALDEARKRRVANKRKNNKLISLDIGDYEDYLNTMSDADGMTRAGYILSLVEKDKANRQNVYEGLQAANEEKLERIKNYIIERFGGESYSMKRTDAAVITVYLDDDPATAYKVYVKNGKIEETKISRNRKNAES